MIRTNGEIYDQQWEETRFDEFNKGIQEDDSPIQTSSHRSVPRSCVKRKITEEEDDEDNTDIFLSPKQPKIELPETQSMESNTTNTNDVSGEETSITLNQSNDMESPHWASLKNFGKGW